MARFLNPVYEAPQGVPLLILGERLTPDYALSERCMARTDLAYDGLVNGTTPLVVLSGGRTAHGAPAEAEAMHRYLADRYEADPLTEATGWAAVSDSIRLETISHNTITNLHHGWNLLDAADYGNVVAIGTDKAHAPRVRLIAQTVLPKSAIVVPVLAPYKPKPADIAWEVGGLAKVGARALKKLRK
jgi:hypothetical protein